MTQYHPKNVLGVQHLAEHDLFLGHTSTNLVYLAILIFINRNMQLYIDLYRKNLQYLYSHNL
jgi:hypothetical protein